MKKVLLATIISALLLASVSCNKNDADNSAVTDNHAAVISLTDEENEILTAIGDDLQVINEADYPETVTELVFHTDAYQGIVIQIEGIFTKNVQDGSIPYVYRNLSQKGNVTICGLPLMYLEKDIPEGAWIRISGIVSSAELDGTTQTVLDVVAVETLIQRGKETIEWAGSAHQH